MEVLIIFLTGGTIVSAIVLKNKIPEKPRYIISFLAGVILIGWFWLSPNSALHWKIIITGIVLYSIYSNRLLKKIMD